MFKLRLIKKFIIYVLKIVKIFQNDMIKKPISETQFVRQALASEARK